MLFAYIQHVSDIICFEGKPVVTMTICCTVQLMVLWLFRRTLHRICLELCLSTWSSTSSATSSWRSQAYML